MSPDEFRVASDEHLLAYQVLVNRMGFTLNRVMPHTYGPDPRRHLLVLYLQPNKELRESLSLTGAEVVCVFSSFSRLDFRAVKAAIDAIKNPERRAEVQF